MKKLFALLAAALMVAGCQTAPAAKPASAADGLLAKVVQRDERIIAYFDTDWDLSKTPVANGYYRKLYGKTAQGHYIAQDFFQESKTKQIDPFEIIDEKGLTQGDETYITGPITWYDMKGEKISMRLYENGKAAGLREVYYPNGQVRIRNEGRYGGPIHETNMYYQDGSKMFWLYDDDDKGISTLKAWHPNGAPALDSSARGKLDGWNAQGKKLNEEQARKLQWEFLKKMEQANSRQD